MAANGKQPSCLCGECLTCRYRVYRRRWRELNPDRVKEQQAKYAKRQEARSNITDAELEARLVNYFVAKGWDDASNIPCR